MAYNHTVKIFFLLTLLVSTFSSAGDLCSGSGIQSIPLPVYSQIRGSPKFKYSFRIRETSKNTPIVIVLGGGPGQNTIAPGSAPILGAFPEEYTLVFTDPRSVGCNKTYPFSNDALGSLSLADDVAFLIEHLQKNQFKGRGYFIYGASFGTQHATILGEILKRRKVKLPKGIILEGISGHHFRDFDEYFQNFQSEWNRIKSEDLSQEVRRFFDSSFPWQSSALGYSSRIWGQFVSSQVILGYLPKAGKQFEHLVNWYLTDPTGKKSATTQMNGLVVSTGDGFAVPVEKLFQVIGCREIWGNFFVGRDVVGGELRATGPDVCQGFSKDRPYDSKQWQIPAPIYYFQGEHDPTTTLTHAKYHFSHQTSLRRMVVVERASHGPLSLALRPCAKEIWNAITLAPEKLEAVSRACGETLGTEIQFLDSNVSVVPF